MDMDDDFYDGDSGNESSDLDCLDFESDGEGSANRVDKESEESAFEVLSIEEVSQHMLECIDEFTSVAEVPQTIARLLLNFCRWDKERLMERFFDPDVEKLFEEAGVCNPFTPVEAQGGKPEAGLEECGICCLHVPSQLMFGLACQHRYCKTCWSEYIAGCVLGESNGQSVACAGYGCQLLVEDAQVLSLVTDGQLKAAYQRRVVQGFVECNSSLRWCPFPDCKFVLRALGDAARVTCKCRHVFCFRCGAPWHDPVKCSLLHKWQKKCDDDSETSNWLNANTKECPKCKVTIEKDGGCNHMVCKNIACKSEFCWVCLGPWEPHGSSWYSCNRYDESEAKQARDAQEKSRAALQRYLFYYNRYVNHAQSLKLESKLYQAVKEKMEEMQQHNMSWIEVQFLKVAVDVLCECRQTLLNTYVFAYYLARTNEAALFEDNQRDLETATETLSEYLERDITQENIADIKQKVQDKYRYCQQRRNKLLEHVHEGYERDSWEYRASL